MRRILFTFIGLGAVLSIVATGGGGGGGGDAGGGGGPTTQPNTISYSGTTLVFTLDLPPILAEPNITDMEVYVTLNGGSRTPLVVDVADDEVSGQITNVVAGTYQLQVVYFNEVAGLETILATFTTPITLVSGQSIGVTISDNDLNKDIDDDADGYTNLAELRTDTDPHDQYSTPATLPVFAVGQGSYGESASTNFTVKGIAGEALTGTSSSTNYQVTAGFSSY